MNNVPAQNYCFTSSATSLILLIYLFVQAFFCSFSKLFIWPFMYAFISQHYNAVSCCFTDQFPSEFGRLIKCCLGLLSPWTLRWKSFWSCYELQYLTISFPHDPCQQAVICKHTGRNLSTSTWVLSVRISPYIQDATVCTINYYINKCFTLVKMALSPWYQCLCN